MAHALWVFGAIAYYVIGVVVLAERMRMFHRYLDRCYPSQSPTPITAGDRVVIAVCSACWPAVLVGDLCVGGLRWGGR